MREWVTIKGMTMPKGCYECSLLVSDENCREYCVDTGLQPADRTKRMEACPLYVKPTGEWKEKSVDFDEDDLIEAWQSARCSICGHYHTTPYLYNFNEFRYCPSCGARMFK